ncbi:MAG: energy transducer TonB [Steroidobacteraceae bacterium]
MTAYSNRRGEEADPSVEMGRTRSMPQKEIVTLTNDSALIRALQELSNEGVSVHVVSDMRTLSDELLQHAGAAAMIDAGSLDAPIEGAVDAITTQFPDLKLMVAGHSPEQTALARRIADQTVFRFVHKPASPQRLKLFVDAAVRPTEAPLGRATTADKPFGDSPSLARIDTAVRGRSPMTLALVGVGAIIAIATLAWFFWLRDSKPAAQAATPPPAQAPVTAASSPAALALIQKADKAFADGRYVALDGSSAAELYREALKVESTNAAARSGFDRSIEYGIRRAEEALLAGKLNEASTVTEALRPLAGNNSRLAFLNGQIDKEQARQNADASQRAANESRQSQVRAELDQMGDRVRRGALLDPATNSAVSHFRAAEQIGPGDPAVRSARESLVAALLTAADNELTAKRVAPSRRMTDAAASLNSSAPGLDVMRRRIDEFTEQQSAASAAASAAEAARLAEAARAQEAANRPAAPVVAAPVVAQNTVVPSTSLKAQRTVAPEYPSRALEQLISGWVEMEFTVARDGSVKDVTVISSEPRRTFDAAATAALRRYRYQPVVRDGETVEQRARMRMRFTPVDGR